MAEVRFRVRITQAARLAGVHKTTILRALKSGKLSATEGHDGARRIDIAELERVYGQLRTGAAPVAEAVARTGALPSENVELVAELRRQIEELRRDFEAREAKLERELEAERTERRELVQVVAKLRLEHHPAPATPRAPRPRRQEKPAPDPAPAPGLFDLALGLLRRR